jgi:hypothetical protein
MDVEGRSPASKIMEEMMKKLICLAALVALTGCATPLTNTEKAKSLRVGMSEDEVTQIMGKPTSRVGGSGFVSMSWAAIADPVILLFKNGRLTGVPD